MIEIIESRIAKAIARLEYGLKKVEERCQEFRWRLDFNLDTEGMEYLEEESEEFLVATGDMIKRYGELSALVQLRVESTDTLGCEPCGSVMLSLCAGCGCRLCGECLTERDSQVFCETCHECFSHGVPISFEGELFFKSEEGS